MIISRLHLVNFGKFTNYEINFNKNINIFYGLNEAGKTTVVDAVAGVLFGFGGRRDDVKKLKARYVPRLNGAVYKAGLGMIIDGIGELFIERDLLTNKAEVFTLQGNLKEYSGFSVPDIVNEFLGVRNIQLFRSTMLIRQEEMAHLAGADISDVLTAKIVTGDQTATLKTVFRALGQKYLELNKGLHRNVANPGPIRQCLDEISLLNGQLESMAKLNIEYEAMQKKAEILEEKIMDLQTRLRDIEGKISLYRKKKELTQQFDGLLQRHLAIETKRLLEREKFAGEQLDYYGRLADKLNQNPYSDTTDSKRNLVSRILFGAGLCLGLLSAAALFTAPEQWRIWPVILLLTGLGLSIGGLVILKAGVPGSSHLQEYRDQINQTGLELQQRTQQLKNLFEQADSVSPEEFRELYDNYRKVLNDEVSETAVKIINLQAESASVPCNINEDRFAGLILEQSDVNENLRTAQIDLAKAQTAIAGFESYALNHNNCRVLENTLMEKQTELESLKLKKNGIAEAVKILRESWHDVQSGIASAIGEMASGVISAITDKKYQYIEPGINETEVNFAAAAEGSGHKTASGLLSAGTRDQVYLSVRIAVAEYLAGTKNFPLILDDPFINFDQVRLKNTVKMLKEIATDHQVILLTKDPGLLSCIGTENVKFL